MATAAKAGRWSADPFALPNERGPVLDPPRRVPTPPCDPVAAAAWLKQQPRPWAVDLFCGAGGLSLGLSRAGFTVVAAADSDPTALRTHEANLGSLTFCGDLVETSEFVEFMADRGLRRADLVAGGPPCQPFSRAGSSKIRNLVASGKRDSTDRRAELWRSFIEVVEQLHPKVVLLENVPDMARWNDGAVLLGVMQALRECGYDPHARVLDAFRYGVPQHRARLFVVGTKSRHFAWPRERRYRPTLRDAIGDLPRVPGGSSRLESSYDGPATLFQRAARKGVPRRERSLVHDHWTRGVRQDDEEAFRLLKPGGTYKELPKRLQRYRADIFDDKYKRLAWDELSRTITAHIARDGYWYIHPEQHRTLSIREAARIQTFPDWFRFAGHPTTQFRQIGNAVPPALAEAVARAVRDALASSRRRRRSSDFASRLAAWHDDNRREFPWRKERDPWRILLAELCLRRTRASAVATTYAELLRLAPTPRAVRTHPDAVRTVLAPLGLRWRAENVVAVADELVERHDGRVPSDEASLRALTGVGDYVASAVRCFAFGVPAVLLDANTRRIVTRLTGAQDAGAWQTRLEIYRLAGSQGPNAEFNYGLLDFGALVCRPTAPDCTRCPFRTRCLFAQRR
jgi:DNA (cytosine-5)-methyltransferase 1